MFCFNGILIKTYNKKLPQKKTVSDGLNFEIYTHHANVAREL